MIVAPAMFAWPIRQGESRQADEFLANSGIIDTPMQRQSTDKRGGELEQKWAIPRKGTALDVANLVAWLLCDASSYISGTVQNIDGGWAC